LSRFTNQACHNYVLDVSDPGNVQLEDSIDFNFDINDPDNNCFESEVYWPFWENKNCCSNWISSQLQNDAIARKNNKCHQTITNVFSWYYQLLSNNWSTGNIESESIPDICIGWLPNLILRRYPLTALEFQYKHNVWFRKDIINTLVQFRNTKSHLLKESVIRAFDIKSNLFAQSPEMSLLFCEFLGEDYSAKVENMLLKFVTITNNNIIIKKKSENYPGRSELELGFAAILNMCGAIRYEWNSKMEFWPENTNKRNSITDDCKIYKEVIACFDHLDFFDSMFIIDTNTIFDAYSKNFFALVNEKTKSIIRNSANTNSPTISISFNDFYYPVPIIYNSNRQWEEAELYVILNYAPLKAYCYHFKLRKHGDTWYIIYAKLGLVA